MRLVLPLKMEAPVRYGRSRTFKPTAFRLDVEVDLADSPAPVALRVHHEKADGNDPGEQTEIRWADDSFWQCRWIIAEPEQEGFSAMIAGQPLAPPALLTLEELRAQPNVAAIKDVEHLIASQRIETTKRAAHFRVHEGLLWKRCGEPFWRLSPPIWRISPLGSATRQPTEHARLHVPEREPRSDVRWSRNHFGINETKEMEKRAHQAGQTISFEAGGRIEVAIPEVFTLHVGELLADQEGEELANHFRARIKALRDEGDADTLQRLLAPLAAELKAHMNAQHLSEAEKESVLKALVD